jgi:hypothetical protein
MNTEVELTAEEKAQLKLREKLAAQQEAEAEKEGMSIGRARMFAPVRKGKRSGGHLHGASRQNRAKV